LFKAQKQAGETVPQKRLKTGSPACSTRIVGWAGDPALKNSKIG